MYLNEQKIFNFYEPKNKFLREPIFIQGPILI